MVEQRVIELTCSSQALFSLSYASFLFFSSCSFSTAARAFAWAWQVHLYKQLKKNEAKTERSLFLFLSYTEQNDAATQTLTF